MVTPGSPPLEASSILHSHKISPLNEYPTYMGMLKDFSIPEDILGDIYLFTIPDHKKTIYKKHYQLIKMESIYQEITFSYEDFLLAYLAAETMFGVISFDSHLLRTIQNFLEFHAFWPEDVYLLPEESIFFLDSNILLSFVDKSKGNADKIAKMFRKTPSVTYLLTNAIIEEMKSVFQRKFQGYSAIEQANILPCVQTKSDDHWLELHLQDYIDDFVGFENRKRLKAKEKHGKKAERLRSHPKSHLVCRRYQFLYETLSK